MLLPLCDSAIVLCFVVRYCVSILVLKKTLIWKIEVVALLCLSSWFLLIVCVGDREEQPQFVNVLFPDHTHLLFLM